MSPWWVTALLTVAATAASILLRPKAKRPTPGEVQFPRADADAAIPVLFGRYRVGLNVIQHAGVRTGRITNPIKILGVRIDKDTIGHFYYLRFNAVLCHGGVSKLYDVIVDGNKSIAALGPQVTGIDVDDDWNIVFETVDPVTPALPASFALWGQSSQTFQIEAANLLGGRNERGGIAGPVTIYGGRTRSHQPDGVLSSETMLPDPDTAVPEAAHPPYPTLCHVVFGAMSGDDVLDVYMGTQPTPPSIEFDIQRVPPNWIGEFTLTDTINDDISPPRVLYEILTNTDWGLGLAPSLIDLTSFDLAGETCHNEELGVSFLLTETQPAREVIDDLLRVLDATLFVHPTTGLLTLFLIRGATDARWGTTAQGTTALTAATVDACEETETVEEAIVNEVKVPYTERAALYQTRVVQARNLAAIYELGRVESRQVEFLGVCERTTAQRLAERELRSLSQPTRKLRLRVDRTGYALFPGAWVTVTWAPLGLSAALFRVQSVREAYAGHVEIEAVAHSFDVEATLSFGGEDEDVPPDGTGAEPFFTPYVLEATEQTTSTGTLQLAVVDPGGHVTLVEFRTKVGALEWSAWAADTAPYAATVARDPLEESAIQYRVTYTDANGDDATISNVVVFAPSASAPPVEPILDRTAAAVLFNRTTGSQLYNRP